MLIPQTSEKRHSRISLNLNDFTRFTQSYAVSIKYIKEIKFQKVFSLQILDKNNLMLHTPGKWYSIIELGNKL